MVREVKNSRAKTKKFSRHFISGLQTIIRLFSVRDFETEEDSHQPTGATVEY
ncbi:DUF1661 domain-containing protein [Porphyromonas gulae]|uniref:DUF1661 domain-containing protein n=1 Tax=Porphyromonas gulae TaxID=111105 RepID=UPI000AB89DED|nr:DUF1661 domain-containing protein [Porphyromonas gulae]